MGKEPHSTEVSRVFVATMDRSGRIVLPAETRLRQSAKQGEALVLEEDAAGQLHLRSMQDVVREAQGYVRSLIPYGISLVDELVAERKEAAAREMLE